MTVGRISVAHKRRKPVRPGQSLSARQLQVVARLLQGDSYKQIAFDLDLTIGTIRTHIEATYRKLGIESRYQLRPKDALL